VNHQHVILKRRFWTPQAFLLATFVLFSPLAPVAAAAAPGFEQTAVAFPPPLESYNDAHLTSLWAILRNRVEKQPFNLWATLLFFGAIIHTFLTHRFRHIAHVLEHRHQERLRLAIASGQTPRTAPR
jgi:RNAse (barnase) inhibitor barstar